MTPKPGQILMIPINGEPQRMEVLGTTVSLLAGAEMVRFLHIANQSLILLPISRVIREAKEAA